MNAVDSNIVVYSVDADGGPKRAGALELLEHLKPTETVILWQVACEVGAVLTRFAAQGRTDADPAAVIAALTTRFALILPPEDLVLDAFRLRYAHQMSY